MKNNKILKIYFFLIFDEKQGKGIGLVNQSFTEVLFYKLNIGTFYNRLILLLFNKSIFGNF